MGRRFPISHTCNSLGPAIHSQQKRVKGYEATRRIKFLRSAKLELLESTQEAREELRSEL